MFDLAAESLGAISAADRGASIGKRDEEIRSRLKEKGLLQSLYKTESELWAMSDEELISFEKQVIEILEKIEVS